MFENLDDPRKQMLLAMAAGLLTPTRAKGGAALGQGIAQGIQGGLLGYTGAQRTQEAVKRGEMDRKMMQERLDAARKAQEAQDYMAQGVKQFMQPGGPGNAPSDGMGPVMPPQQPSFDRQGFAGYLAQNPATALKAPEFCRKRKARSSRLSVLAL